MASASKTAVKLSPKLKTLITTPHAKGLPLAAPRGLKATTSLFEAVATSAKANGLGHDVWLTLSAATLTTINSPESLKELYSFATKSLAKAPNRVEESAMRAAIMREAALKTISFNGIPKAINNLNALASQLEPEVAAALRKSPVRELTPDNVTLRTQTDAKALWDDIYEPFSAKLLSKLAESHPDLPVHILSSHYGPLLCDPPELKEGNVGRVLTSVVAIASLRAQRGVEPQVKSHVFGLRNAASAKEGIKGEAFLTSDDGASWVLTEVDRITNAIEGGQVTKAKL
ncbi:mitochondrial protein [Pseudohyphozyma bogoriensis]|nr:mitochondrial protein [Pseudohyphozyma bogoriensis]